MAKNVKQRILDSIAKDANGCWIWQRSISPAGYGRLTLGSRSDGSRQTVASHRVAYECFNGPIPDGLTIDHLCKVRACANPEHLEAVTMKENIHRGNPLWKQEAARTHCPQGHQYTDTNTYRYRVWNGSFARSCRECALSRSRARRQRRAMGVA